MFFDKEQQYEIISNSAIFPKVLFMLIVSILFFPIASFSQEAVANNEEADDLLSPDDIKRFSHNLGIEFRPAYVIPSTLFLKGLNNKEKPIRASLSGHLKYSFGFPADTIAHQVYSNTYQGVGVSYFDFGNRAELGNPVAVYLFQRSRIAKLGRRASLNYEWNFGLSGGWKPYDYERNPYNVVIGSKLNAYINVGMFVNWDITDKIGLATGVDLSHFSNGNTDFPNAGLNTAGLKVGLLYDFRKQKTTTTSPKRDTVIPRFQRHISYDFVAFGSWRRKGVEFSGQQYASPYEYPVIGAYFAPMYNFGYRFRAGLSLDAVYDGSANVYTKDFISGTDQDFFKPGIDHQMALGISGRAEYIMPIFTISMGGGVNFLHKGGDLRGTYQTLALKVRTTRNSFIHIGYNLKDFHEPNYLMLGLGYRFNNRTRALFY
ncbi:MAG: acyloxyacyl hydrolase [Niabella sp.]